MWKCVGNNDVDDNGDDFSYFIQPSSNFKGIHTNGYSENQSEILAQN